MLLALLSGIYIGKKMEGVRLRTLLEREFQIKEKEIRRDAVERSKRSLKGKGLEHLAPYFHEFSYLPSDARFLGTPVDFVIFKGNTVGKPEEVIFLEVKSGRGNLSKKERMWKEIIKNGNVKWEMMRL